MLEDIFKNPENYEWIPDNDLSDFRWVEVPMHLADRSLTIEQAAQYTLEPSHFKLQAYLFDLKQAMLPWFFGRYNLEMNDAGGLGVFEPEGLILRRTIDATTGAIRESVRYSRGRSIDHIGYRLE